MTKLENFRIDRDLRDRPRDAVAYLDYNFPHLYLDHRINEKDRIEFDAQFGNDWIWQTPFQLDNTKIWFINEHDFLIFKLKYKTIDDCVSGT
jgi:hypothetical protein